MDLESTFTMPEFLSGLTVDQLGRPLDNPAAIRSGIPAWHPRNDEETEEEKATREAAEAAAAEEEETPEGDTFDRAYVEKLRRENAAARKRAKDAEEKAKAFEDRDKSEAEKTAEKLATAQQRAAYAEQLDVALDKAPEGMTLAQVRKLAKRLTGSSREELEADAVELFADFAPSAGNEQDSTRRTPRERLRPGAVPAAEADETDPAKLAAMVPRS